MTYLYYSLTSFTVRSIFWLRIWHRIFGALLAGRPLQGLYWRGRSWSTCLFVISVLCLNGGCCSWSTTTLPWGTKWREVATVTCCSRTPHPFCLFASNVAERLYTSSHRTLPSGTVLWLLSVRGSNVTACCHNSRLFLILISRSVIALPHIACTLLDYVLLPSFNSGTL